MKHVLPNQKKEYTMSTQIIIGILGILGTILGSLLTYFLTKKRSEAEADKFKAEAEKARAEAEKIRRELHPSPASSKSEAHTPSSVGEITVLAAERSQLSLYYAEQSRSAAAIDMISLTLLSAMENFGNNKFVQWIQDGKKIRVLMLSPLSTAAELRSLEESVNKGFLRTKIIKQIEELKSLHTEAEKQLKGRDYTGSLEVRLFDDLPYFSYFHTDKVMVMGLYYGHIRGLQSEALLIDEKSSIHAKMCAQFEYLWSKSGRHGASTITLCSIVKGHIFFNHPLLKSFQSPTQ
jgi:hypothetical protein